MYGYIYQTTNKINGKKYIGQHRCASFDTKYYGSGTTLQKAIDKYGKENFEIKILVECENEEELNFQERRLIQESNAVLSEDYYNIADGGSMGNPLAGKSAEEVAELVKNWREKMNSRTSESKEKTYQQWLKSYTDKTAEELRERHLRQSNASKKAQANMSEETKSLKIQKMVDTKNSYSEEKKQQLSKRYTELNNSRWKLMTPEKLQARTLKYKSTRAKRTAEQNILTSCKIRDSVEQYHKNLSAEEKQRQTDKKKSTWKNKSEEEKQAYSKLCSERMIACKYRWIHNNDSECKVPELTLSDYFEKGFVLGRLRK